MSARLAVLLLLALVALCAVVLRPPPFGQRACTKWETHDEFVPERQQYKVCVRSA